MWSWSSVDKIANEVLRLLVTTEEPLKLTKMSITDSIRDEK